MRVIKNLTILLCLLLRLLPAAAQQGRIAVSGTVSDSDGYPIPGASVIESGTRNGVSTDLDGIYKMSVEAGTVLDFQCIGYRSIQVKVSGAGTYNVTLLEDMTLLEDAVVVGYGTIKKANLTGAVDQITSDAFEGRANASLSQMLTGQIPNLNLKFTDGRPDSSPSYNIRGTTSIGQGGSALVLIDGVEGDPAMLNPNDIESVSVLKDAASSAIYGSRAPYGVVLITTKNPVKDKVTANYSSTFIFEKPTNTPDFIADGVTYATMFYDAWFNYNHTSPDNINSKMYYSNAWLAEYKKRAAEGDWGIEVSDGSFGIPAGRWVYYVKGTDYINEIYKDYSFTHSHNFSLSGSSGNFSYYLSGRYYNNNGLFNSETNPDHYTMMDTRLKVTYQATPWLKISNNTNISSTVYRTPQNNTGEGGGNVWRNIADNGAVCSPIYNPDGTLTINGIYTIGDFLNGYSWKNFDKKQYQNTIGATASFFDNALRFNADFTVRIKDVFNTYRKTLTPFSRYEGVLENISGKHQYMEEIIRDYRYLATNEYVEYEKTFGKNWVKGMLGYNYEQQIYKSTDVYNDGLLTQDVENINLAMGTENMQLWGDWYKWRTVGQFVRLNYVYDERYLLEFNGRLDGSSKFPSLQRWAFFPSLSAGWRISKEPWFKVSPAAISNIKFRASYGSLGNGNVSAYSYDEKFSFSHGGQFNGQAVRYTSAPSPIPSSLTWETSRTVDVGLDLAFLSNRLTFTGDWYDRRTLDMYTVGPTLPDVYGASSPKGNYANLKTVGYEMILEWKDSFSLLGKAFNYSLRGTLADYVSTITKYNNATKTLSTNNDQAKAGNYYTGMTIGEIWGFDCDGFWQTQEEINAAMLKVYAAGQQNYNPLMQTSSDYRLYPGDIKIVDRNGNGYIDRGDNTVDNPGDRRIIGNSDPRYIYSFRFDMEWNNFYCNIFFQGVGKQNWYPVNDSAFFWGQYNRPYSQVPKWQLGNFWTEDNRDAYLPRYTGYYGAAFKGTTNANTRYLQDVSYIRLKNLQIGYNLPDKWAKKMRVARLGIYLTMENLWTWSPMYRHTRDIDITANIYGNDSYTSTAGDGYNFPTMKSMGLGLNVTL